MRIITDTSGCLVVTHSVLRAVVRATELGAVRSTETSVARALAGSEVAGAVSTAVVGAQDLLAGLTTETSWRWKESLQS